MKPYQNIKPWLIAVALVITIIVLFGGQALTVKFRVDNPLKHDIFAIKGVKEFDVTQDKAGVKVHLKLSPVTNLQQVLDPIQQKVEFYYHKPISQINIGDHSNSILAEMRYQLSFNLEEAVVTGHYMQLRSALELYPQVKSRIYFSPGFIYIQMDQGRYYHYEAFPRQMNISSKTVGGEVVS